ncbi:WhiB family transcriptional regulator [Blastococcus sp. CT_GayMR16]|uniref:WhiB family transcriptional regulator n=1 Tax=Blastococcus sp. CT_GayMR16 TaxID=2559607 RepID=UPI001072FB31|nr:WhiB family transcriptional regulator [Blastococcus sp. CT_GayMR16]TFV90418.1 hypothetical protein E4P38_02975 [Blastococcus sp. CT_GayMR16]
MATASSPRSTPPPPELTTGAWRDRAACHDHPRLKPAAWDDGIVGIHETVQRRAKRIGRAKAVCRTECPVRWEVLAAVNLDYDEGIRGGEDLRDLKAARRRARAGWAT